LERNKCIFFSHFFKVPFFTYTLEDRDSVALSVNTFSDLSHFVPVSVLVTKDASLFSANWNDDNASTPLTKFYVVMQVY
jgi:hypothetical protein